jgi:protein-S-isoprenylcysteine O-methyltransferase Ste14
MNTTRPPPLWRHLLAIGLLPFVVTIVVPLCLATAYPESLHLGWEWGMPLALLPTAFGPALLAVGGVLMGRTISLFHAEGRGTLAPWDPTQRLVVRGVYRHVRNPMISGVFCILLGEAILLGSLPIGIWFGCFVLGNTIYIPLSEEPGLEARFGDDYRRYRENVPRWIPRRSPWKDLDPGTYHG